MSDIILKFWPEENVSDNKVLLLEGGLTQKQIIGEPTEFWGKPAFKPGQQIRKYLDPKMKESNWYYEEIVLTIDTKDYAVEMGAEDFEYIDRNNVVSIKGGDGTPEVWNKLCAALKEITGDEYIGGWELL